MEKETNFTNCHLNLSTLDSYHTLPDQLRQCPIPQFDSGHDPVGHLKELQSQQWSSAITNTACFSSQSFNSPSKFHLSMMGSPNQGTRESGFASNLNPGIKIPSFGPVMPNYGLQFPLSESGRVPVGLAESKNESRSSCCEDGDLRSSASERTVNKTNGRKRKSIQVGEDGSEVSATRNRAMDSGGDNVKDDEVKAEVEIPEVTEAPKQDYIHVRARRGQATDPHSLAERVRREKISDRMKFLQNLVPGCNKVTGKAVMLDEIINYVQSLQRQVEFLSMKLATVNPRLDINVQSLLSKDVNQPCPGSLSHPIYPTTKTRLPVFPFSHQLPCVSSNGQENRCSTDPIESMTTRRPPGVQLPTHNDEFDNAGSQVGVLWGDDLHRIVQMGSGHNIGSHNFA